MADLGTDIDCLTDIGKVFGLSTGRLNLARAIARRFLTPRGGLFYDLNYGFSLIQLLSSEATRANILSQGPAIEAEALKDERVLSATAVLTFDDSARKLTITLALQDAAGPFRLVLQASGVSVSILEVQ